MKKIIICIVLLVLLVGCQSEETFFFKATIQEVYDGSYIVVVDEGEDVRSSSDLISIDTEELFKVGDRVIVEFDGVIMESYPAQINLISIELE